MRENYKQLKFNLTSVFFYTRFAKIGDNYCFNRQFFKFCKKYLRALKLWGSFDLTRIDNYVSFIRIYLRAWKLWERI